MTTINNEEYFEKMVCGRRVTQAEIDHYSPSEIDDIENMRRDNDEHPTVQKKYKF